MGQGAYILGCAGPRLSAAEHAFFAKARPWGFILFARNVENPDQLRALTGDLRAAVGRDAPVLIDQEGGRVQRMAAPHWRQWLPPFEQVVASGNQAERSMWLRYRLIADELRDVGIDVNCVPNADVATSETHPFLANRCYGFDADIVARIASSVVAGLQAGGVSPVQKHMPGHGRAVTDSHFRVPQVAASRDELAKTDFLPFTRLKDLTMGMTGHVLYSDIDPVKPATMSAGVIRLIRNDIGFGGLLMTDDISMQALNGTLSDRCAGAIGAGCDMVLHCNGDLQEMAVVADVAGLMVPKAQARADRAIAARPVTQPIDIKDAEAELRTLVKGYARV